MVDGKSKEAKAKRAAKMQHPELLRDLALLLHWVHEQKSRLKSLKITSSDGTHKIHIKVEHMPASCSTAHSSSPSGGGAGVAKPLTTLLSTRSTCIQYFRPKSAYSGRQLGVNLGIFGHEIG